MARTRPALEANAGDLPQKVGALRNRVALLPPHAKVEVEAGTLRSLLNAVGQASPDDEISPQEAAMLLRMSRPSVMRLIAKGALHPRKVLSRHKLSRAEVLAYRHAHERAQRQALANLTALSDELDF